MRDPLDKKTLLIIDDVELFIHLQISHLGNHRYDIHTASNGLTGLEAARAINPDLILLDLLMPDMNGDEVCRILKDDPETSSIPVVLISSGTREHSRSIIKSSGCDGLIYKPVRRDLLLTVVETLLETNQRTAGRVDVTLPCTVTLDGDEQKGTIHTLSSSGAFIEYGKEVIRGDMVDLTFNLPAMGYEINVRSAVVVWCQHPPPEGPEGMGVQFLTLDPGAKKRIDDFVRMHLGTESLVENLDSETGS